ncbi:hypothetical protein IE53DRAFT_385139 [Violaceomyces palustris]|uniref:Uncharacterized protein n=1 Tax=Violaceomyces palustris TaxID=1673888 RepID=A0ACD0P2W6_9BASI|nr:hypothetical protein IE53DRAFT_385139 [Violaceomyces palustris]
MPSVPSKCPSCGSLNSIEYLPQIYNHVCNVCGHCVEDVAFETVEDYHPSGEGLDYLNRPDSSVVGSAALLSRFKLPQYSIEVSREASRYQNRPQIVSLIVGSLRKLGHESFHSRAINLFDQAKEAAQSRMDKINDFLIKSKLDKSFPQVAIKIRRGHSIISWGSLAEYMAAACIFAALRREKVLVSLETVSEVCGTPLSKTLRSLRYLKSLASPGLDCVDEFHPEVYVDSQVDWFQAVLEDDERADRLLSSDIKSYLQPFKRSTAVSETFKRGGEARDPAASLDKVRELAKGISNIFWPLRKLKVDSKICTFSIILLAFEGVLKRVCPQVSMFRIAPMVVWGGQDTLAGEGPPRPREEEGEGRRREQEDEEDDEDEAEEDPDQTPLNTSRTAIQQRYSEVSKLLSEWAMGLPWVREMDKDLGSRDSLQRQSAVLQNIYATDDPLPPKPGGREVRYLKRWQLAFYIEDVVLFKDSLESRFEERREKMAEIKKKLRKAFGNKENGNDVGEAVRIEVLRSSLLEFGLKFDDAGWKKDFARSRIRKMVRLLERLERERRQREEERTSNQGLDASLKSYYENLKDKIIDHVRPEGRAASVAASRTKGNGKANVKGKGKGVDEHLLDLLNEEEVDSLLFSKGEMQSYLRNEGEVEKLRLIKISTGDWDDGSDDLSQADGGAGHVSGGGAKRKRRAEDYEEGEEDEDGLRWVNGKRTRARGIRFNQLEREESLNGNRRKERRRERRARSETVSSGESTEREEQHPRPKTRGMHRIGTRYEDREEEVEIVEQIEGGHVDKSMEKGKGKEVGPHAREDEEEEEEDEDEDEWEGNGINEEESLRGLLDPRIFGSDDEGFGMDLDFEE